VLSRRDQVGEHEFFTQDEYASRWRVGDEPIAAAFDAQRLPRELRSQPVGKFVRQLCPELAEPACDDSACGARKPITPGITDLSRRQATARLGPLR